MYYRWLSCFVMMLILVGCTASSGRIYPSNPTQMLTAAITAKDLEKAKEAIDKGADVNAETYPRKWERRGDKITSKEYKKYTSGKPVDRTSMISKVFTSQNADFLDLLLLSGADIEKKGVTEKGKESQVFACGYHLINSGYYRDQCIKMKEVLVKHGYDFDRFDLISQFDNTNENDEQLAFMLEHSTPEDIAAYKKHEQAAIVKRQQMEGQRQAEREERIRAREKAAQMRAMEEQRRREFEDKKRVSAKEQISHKGNIGRLVCRNGTLQFPVNRYHSEQIQGQLQGFLEGFSEDGYRIQFRVSVWAIPHDRYAPPGSSTPRLGNLIANAGLVYWDDVTNWFLC